MRSIISLLLLLLIATPGCYYYSRDRLKRTPEKKIHHERKRSAVKKSDRDKDENQLFNTIFKRKQQDFSKGSMLSEREKEIMRRNDPRHDPAVRSMHNKGRKSNTQNKDWVFGTKNGSYF